jgi:hypothetical protein
MVRFPLLLIPLAIYNIVVWLMPSVSFTEALQTKIPLVSGAEWAFTPGDILLVLGVVLLLIEVMKGARPGAKYLTDHLLSLIVFAVAAAEFVLLRQFGNSLFFLLTLLALVEFLSGISLHTRRGRLARQVAPAAVEPAPVPEPPAASVEPSEPRPTGEPSPSITSPDLQPSSGSSAPPDKQ